MSKNKNLLFLMSLLTAINYGCGIFHSCVHLVLYKQVIKHTPCPNNISNIATKYIQKVMKIFKMSISFKVKIGDFPMIKHQLTSGLRGEFKLRESVALRTLSDHLNLNSGWVIQLSL